MWLNHVEKTYKEKVVDDEDWVTYTVTVTNAGNQTLYNTKIVDTMDLALEMDPDSIKRRVRALLSEGFCTTV